MPLAGGWHARCYCQFCIIIQPKAKVSNLRWRGSRSHRRRGVLWQQTRSAELFGVFTHMKFSVAPETCRVKNRWILLHAMHASVGRSVAAHVHTTNFSAYLASIGRRLSSFVQGATALQVYWSPGAAIMLPARLIWIAIFNLIQGECEGRYNYINYFWLFNERGWAKVPFSRSPIVYSWSACVGRGVWLGFTGAFCAGLRDLKRAALAASYKT